MLVLTIDTATSYVVSGLVEVTRREVPTAGDDRRFASAPPADPTYEHDIRTINQRIIRNPRGHMELLVPNIQEMLAESELRPADIHAVVVGTGPGPFTGLRVGMATGAAFADALKVPVFGVDSLAAAAASLPIFPDATASTTENPQHSSVLVVSDARRREWYSALVGTGADNAGELLAGPTVSAPDEVTGAYPQVVVALTAEVAAAVDEGKTTVPAEWEVVSQDAHPTPEGLARVAAKQLWWLDGDGHFATRLTRPLEPKYLRRPDAVPPKAKERSTAVDFTAADNATGQPATKTADGNFTFELLTGDNASDEDYANMLVIERRLFAEESPWPLAGFVAELENKRNHYIAVRRAGGSTEDSDGAESRAGELVGYAGLTMSGPIEDPEWEVHTVAIHPDLQGRGLARPLMDALLAPVEVVGGDVFLEVREGNAPAIGLYESYGFDVTGRRKGYYQPSGADALTMRRPDPTPRAADSEEHSKATPESAENMLVMGIESSCDETGVGVVELHQATVRERVNQVASSMEQHARFGGVVPEIASRAHLEAMQPTMRAAMRTLDRAGVRRRPDAVATTIGPGLAGALMVGAAAAKAYAAAWEVPFYAVNHLGVHVAVDSLREPESAQPLEHAIALLVSGGHTQILEVNGIGTPMRELGSTLDDAAGEAYDKVARLLGLGYPGGPVIDRLARKGNKKAIAFPRGMMRPQDSRYDFSFSGLKTAVARYVERAEAEGKTGENAMPIEDVCASFQEAVADVLTAKALRACEDTGAKVLLLGGGVSANSRLRELAADRCRATGVELRIPPLPLCTDNGVMIAALAAELIATGAPASPLGVGTDPSLEVEVPLLR